MKVNDSLVRGDVISFYTSYKNDIKKGSFDLFFKSTKSIAYGYANDLQVIYKNDDLRSEIHDSLVEESNWYSDISLMLLYGEKQGKGATMNEMIDSMGISHLFVVSGFHISLFFVLLENFGKFFIKNRKLISVISFSISIMFLYLIYFPPTGVRALITIILIRSGKNNRVESLSLTGIIFFILNPWLMLSNSMILSFSITYAIYFYRPKEVSIIDMVTLSMFAFYISLPTISTWKTEHNLFAPLLSLVLTPIVSFMYVISLLFLPFKNMWSLLSYVFCIFYYITLIFSKIHLSFTLPLNTIFRQYIIIVLCLYYIYLLRNNKYVILNTFFSISIIIFLI